MNHSEQPYIRTRVARDAWETAQTWERQFWLREQRALKRRGKNLLWKVLATLGLVEKYRGDDSNRWWAGLFDHYRFLPPSVDNMIEVGCGPYTNARLVREACSPKHLFLSDPLIRTYTRFTMTLVRELYETNGCYLDDHALEELPFRDSYFDVAIMINVLDHVQDAAACMATLTRILKPGGYVIIGQDLTNEADFDSHPDGMRTGHPITLDADWFTPYLEGFSPRITRVLPREEGRAPAWHYGTLLFAGVKLG